jgi:hypothetical protein
MAGRRLTLPTLLRQPPLALSDPEAPQTLNVFRRVVAVSARSTPGERQRAEPFAKPEPAYADVEFCGRLGYRVCPLPNEHADIVDLANRFL